MGTSPPPVRVDWTFKAADVIKIGILLVTAILAYAHQESRLDRVEEQSAKNARVLADHIEKQNDSTEKLNLLLEKLQVILREYPPHLHYHGQIIYPHDGDVGQLPAIP